MTDSIYDNFGNFVANFSKYDQRTAVTIKPFIRIDHLDYHQLQQRVYQTAQYLKDSNLKTGQRIMIVAPNSPIWVELLLAAQLIGVTVVPVDLRSNLATVKIYISQTKPELIFKSKHLHSELDHDHSCVDIDSLEQAINQYPMTAPALKLTGHETAVIVFTSGTTANPKGVVLTQQNVLSNVNGIRQSFTIDPNWRFLSVLPLSHMYEMTGGCLLPLASGASIYYLTKVTPMAIAKGLTDYRITTIMAVPQLLILFLQRIRTKAAEQGMTKALSGLFYIAPAVPFKLRRHLFGSVHKKLGGKLDIVATGGAPIPIEVAIDWEKMGVRMVQGYGLTETSPVLTFNRPNDRRLDSQGRAIANVELRIDTADSEIQAKGPGVFDHYLDNQSATKEAFTKDGWFKTGDIGRLKDGWLQIQGRAKFAIVLSSGLKVFPEDIELVADRNTAFKSICIIGLKQAQGETVQAVVISDKSDKEVEQAISDINAELESFQYINSWVRWPQPDFPRTRLLKIDRKLIEQWANNRQNSDLGIQASTKDDDQLANIIRLVIDKPRAHFKETDKMADIGLDSLRRLATISLIEEQLGTTVSESEVTQKTTLAQLRKLVKEGKPAEASEERSTWAFNKGVRWCGSLIRETLIRGILRIWVKQHSEGTENLEKLKGPAIFIFNHVDDFDVPVVYRSLPKSIRSNLAIAVGADVLRDHISIAILSRLLYAGFPFARSEPYLPSLEYVGRLIDRGWNVALAPEGKLSTNGKLQSFKSGIGLLAVELRVPVVPVKTIGLSGTVPLHTKWPQQHSKVIVKIGPPVSFDSTTSYDEATKQLQKIITDL